MQPSDSKVETDAFNFFEPEPGSDGFIPYWSFSPEDITGLESLAAKLREPNGSDELSKFLGNSLGDNTRKLLSKYEKGEDKRLRQALVTDLNRIIRCHFHEHRRMTYSKLEFSKSISPYKLPDQIKHALCNCRETLKMMRPGMNTRSRHRCLCNDPVFWFQKFLQGVLPLIHSPAGDIKELLFYLFLNAKPRDCKFLFLTLLTRMRAQEFDKALVQCLQVFAEILDEPQCQAVLQDVDRLLQTGNLDLGEFFGYKWPDRAIISLGEEKLCSGRLEELGLDEPSFHVEGNQDEKDRARKLRVIGLLDCLTDRFPAIQLNRMLLHHAYPDEISRRPQQPLIYLNVDNALRDAALCASARSSAWPYWDLKSRGFSGDVLRIEFNDKTEAVESAKSLTALRSEMALTRGVSCFDNEFDIDSDEKPQRLDAWLSRKIPHIPLETLRDWIASGRVRVNRTSEEGYPHSNCVPQARQIRVAHPESEATNAHEEVTVKQDEAIECTLEEYAGLYRDFATKLLSPAMATKPPSFIKLDQRLLRLAKEWIRIFGEAQSIHLVPRLAGTLDGGPVDDLRWGINCIQYYGTPISRETVDKNGLLVVVIPTHKEMLTFLRQAVANCSPHKPRSDQSDSADQSSKVHSQRGKTYLVTIGKSPENITTRVFENGIEKPFERDVGLAARKTLCVLVLLKNLDDVDTQAFADLYNPGHVERASGENRSDNIFGQGLDPLKKLLKGVDFKRLGIPHHRRIFGLQIKNNAKNSELREYLEMLQPTTRDPAP